MIHLVFLLEEESSKSLLDSLLPRVFPKLNFRCFAFEGKQDLEKNIPIKLRGYRVPNTKFIIIRDQDSEDCIEVKQKLNKICEINKHPNILIRIACKELESWYFGDLHAVEKALEIPNLALNSRKKQYKIPDKISNPKTKLKKISNNKYKQSSSSKIIGNEMNYLINTSHSFNIFIKGVEKLLNEV